MIANLRAVLLSAANVMLLDPKIQFSTIMRSENTIVIRRLAQFIMDANKLRDSLETAIQIKPGYTKTPYRTLS